MSKSYYCNDCKKAVDLEEALYVSFCKECEGTNWKAIIDTPSGETKGKE